MNDSEIASFKLELIKIAVQIGYDQADVFSVYKKLIHLLDFKF